PEQELAQWYPNLTATPRTDDPLPAALAFCAEHRGDLVELVRTRTPQTNEIGRCALLLVGLDRVATEVGALAQLDVILGDHYGDPHYFARRQSALLVGVDCLPDEHCFCGQVGTARAEGKCDVFLTDVGLAYLVECWSDEGREAVEGFGGLEEVTPAVLEAARARMERKLAGIEPRLSAPVEMLPMLLDGHQKASEWEDVAAKCVSCGACNLVCPTCNCFDVYDEVALSLTEAERKRRWDGCMLREFTLVAGGEVFREGKPDRLRHRMQRKYNYLYVRYGSPFCTGCGRCARSCPAGIHPVSAVNQVTASES
ncbi:MAG TPA: DUF2332 family protein, partial [Armatimonadota bacterium]|nr:DUF2332 family protein [Armatimonadota bacterium]